MNTDLFTHTHARSDDPQTSKDAARAAEKFSGGQYRQILDLLDAHYPMAFSVEDMQASLGFDCHRRIFDLAQAGLIVMAGYTILKSGLRGRTWRLVA